MRPGHDKGVMRDNSMTFETILERMAAIHKAKNADYGSSYNLARACRLSQGQAPQVEGEALTDTLLDLANYAVLAILAVEGKGA